MVKLKKLDPEDFNTFLPTNITRVWNLDGGFASLINYDYNRGCYLKWKPTEFGTDTQVRIEVHTVFIRNDGWSICLETPFGFNAVYELWKDCWKLILIKN